MSKKTTARGTTAVKRRTADSTRSTAGGAKTATKRTVKKPAGGKPVKGPGHAKPTPSSVAPPPASSLDPIKLHQTERPLPKTRLTEKELEEFKDLLLSKRAELAGDVRRLTDEALNSKGPGSGERSAMPIHMADVGSDNWEQEFTLGLIANEEALVREIDEALKRIDDRTYGVCLATRKRISKARLRAKPWAKYCIEYARAREEGRVP